MSNKCGIKQSVTEASQSVKDFLAKVFKANSKSKSGIEIIDSTLEDIYASALGNEKYDMYLSNKNKSDVNNLIEGNKDEPIKQDNGTIRAENGTEDGAEISTISETPTISETGSSIGEQNEESRSDSEDAGSKKADQIGTKQEVVGSKEPEKVEVVNETIDTQSSGSIDIKQLRKSFEDIKFYNIEDLFNMTEEQLDSIIEQNGKLLDDYKEFSKQTTDINKYDSETKSYVSKPVKNLMHKIENEYNKVKDKLLKVVDKLNNSKVTSENKHLLQVGKSINENELKPVKDLKEDLEFVISKVSEARENLKEAIDAKDILLTDNETIAKFKTSIANRKITLRELKDKLEDKNSTTQEILNLEYSISKFNVLINNEVFIDKHKDDVKQTENILNYRKLDVTTQSMIKLSEVSNYVNKKGYFFRRILPSFGRENENINKINDMLYSVSKEGMSKDSIKTLMNEVYDLTPEIADHSFINYIATYYLKGNNKLSINDIQQNAVNYLIDNIIKLKTESSQNKIDDSKLSEYKETYLALNAQGFMTADLSPVQLFVNDASVLGNKKFDFKNIKSLSSKPFNQDGTLVEMDGYVTSAIAMIYGSRDENNNLEINDRSVKLNDQVNNAVKIQSIASLRDMYTMQELQISDEDFDKLWGLLPGSEVDRYELKQQMNEGYLPQAFILEKLGNAIYNDIGMKVSINTNSSIQEEIKKQLALYAIAQMEENNILIPEEKDENRLVSVGTLKSPKFQRVIKLPIESRYSNKRLEKGDNVNDSEFESKTTKSGEVKLFGKNNELYKEFLQSSSSLMSYLDAKKDRPKPSLTPLKERFDRTVRNSTEKLSEDSNRIINDYESTPQKFNEESELLYQAWKINKTAAYAMVGINTVDLQGTGKNYFGNRINIEDVESQAIKNNNERIEFDTLMEFYGSIRTEDENGKASTKEFYLPWDYTVSGRYMTDSDVNPQSSKITRILVQSKTMDTDIRFDNNSGSYKINETDLYSAKVGLAQALDYSMDKKKDLSSFEQMEKDFSIGDDGKVTWTEKGIKSDKFNAYNFFKNKDTIFNELKSIAEDSTQDVNKALSAEFKSIESEYKISKLSKIGEGVHGMAAIKFLADLDTHARKLEDYNNSKSLGLESLEPEVDSIDLKTSFTAEADDITSGMILTLMNVGTESARIMLEKGGVYTKEAKQFWERASTIISDIVKNDETLSQSYKIPSAIYEDGYNGMKLTHGYLTEFGNVISSIFNNDEHKAIFMKKASEQLSEDEIDRANFKDFYNTVAYRSEQEIKDIEKNIINKMTDGDLKDVASSVSIEVRNTMNNINKFASDMALKVVESSQSAYEDKYKGNSNRNDIYSIFSINTLGNLKTYNEKSKSTYVDRNELNNFAKWIQYIAQNAFKDIEMNAEQKVAYQSILNASQEKYEYLQRTIDNEMIKRLSSSKKELKDKKEIKDRLEFLIKSKLEDSQNKEDTLRLLKKTYAKIVSQELVKSSMDTLFGQEEVDFLKDGKQVWVNKKPVKQKVDKINTDDIPHLNSLKEKMISVSNKRIDTFKEAKNSGDYSGLSIRPSEMYQQYNNAIMSLATIKLVGNKISRSLAKDPVMVYIYGSSINSIKKKILNNIIKEKIYEYILDTSNSDNAVKLLNENKDMNTSILSKSIIESNEFDAKNISFQLLMNEITDTDFNNGRMVTIGDNGKAETKYVFKQYNPDKKVVESVKTSQIESGYKHKGISSIMKNMVITPDMITKLSKVNDMTYGKAFEKGFELFKDVDNFRKIIKTLELIRYSIYKNRLNNEFMKLAVEKGIRESDIEKGYVQLKLTDRDIRNIKSNLDKNNLGHNVSDSNSAKQSLASTEKILKGKSVVVSISRNTSYQSDTQHREETENTGASGVVTVHQLDGRKIGLSLEGTGMLNIYDAFYSSLGSMTQISNNMNQEFVNVTTSYHVLDTHLEQIENMLLAMSPREIDDMIKSIALNENEKSIISKGVRKIDSKWFENEMLTTEADRMYDIIDNTINIKNSLSSNETDIDVMHNYLTDRTEFGKGKAFGYKNKNVDIPNIYYVLGRIINASQSKALAEVVNEDGTISYVTDLDEEYNMKMQQLSNMRKMSDIIDKEILDKEVGAIDNIINGIFGVTNDKTNSKEVPNEIKDIMNEIKKCIE